LFYPLQPPSPIINPQSHKNPLSSRTPWIFLEMLWSIIIHALFKIPYFISFCTNFIYYYHSFKTRSGPRGSTRDWNGTWLKKKHGKEQPSVTQLTRLTRRVDSTTRSKTRLQLIDFCFFFLLKQCRFDFFFLRIDPDDPVKI
jgi:hypothetical protein